MATLFAISGDPVHPNWKCGRYRSKWFSMTIWIIDLKFSMSGVNSPKKERPILVSISARWRFSEFEYSVKNPHKIRKNFKIHRNQGNH